MPIRLRYKDVAPEGFAALTGFGHYVNTGTELEPVLLGLVNLLASMLNSCGFCTALHSAELRKLHEPQSRIEGLRDWRSSDAFTPREKAALAWTEAITDIQGSHASEEEYAAVTQFFHDKELVDLTYAIANINAWNRLGVAFRPEFHAEHDRGEKAGAAGTEKVKTEEGRAETVAVVDDDGGKVAED